MGIIGKRAAIGPGLLNMTFNLLFGGLTLLITLMFADETITASILLGILFVIGIIKWRSNAAFITALFGIFAGTVCEMALTTRGVWEYGQSDFFGVPVYLFFIWGNTAAFIYQCGLETRKFLGENNKPGAGKDSFINSPLFPVLIWIVSFISIMMFYKNPFLLLGINTLISAIVLIMWKSKTIAIVFVFSAVSGAYSEIIAINYGVWAYPRPGVLNIPLWLIITWGCVGACLYMLGSALE